MSACIEIAEAIEEMLRETGGFHIGSAWVAAAEVQGENGIEVIALTSHESVKIFIEMQYRGRITLKVFCVDKINEFEVRQVAKDGTLLLWTSIGAVREWRNINEKLSKAPLDKHYAFDALTRELSSVFKSAPLEEHMDSPYDDDPLSKAIMEITDALKRGVISDSVALALLDKEITRLGK